MYIKQSELLLGTSMDFVKKYMDNTEMVSHDKGDILFQENDSAKFFYTLINGQVKLSICEGGRVVHDIKQSGEAFGWSSLIGRDIYSASAECMEPTELLRTDSQKLMTVIAKDPANGIILFKHLAAMLGNRLLESYQTICQMPE